MSKAPCVSVVIPAYRHQAFVGEAIASVLNQTFEDFELIVIDDGSPDDTAAVAERALAGDPRARLLRQPNAGSHATINRGLELARGDWIAILNSDDRYHPERLARLLAAAGDEHDFLVTDLRLIDSAGEAVTDPGHWFNGMIESFRQYARTNGHLAGLLHGNYTASTSNFFFRRDLVATIGGFRDYRYIVDWEFALRAALQAPERFAYLIDQPLFDYRIHGANTILAGALRGALEIDQMQRGLLVERYGVPRALLTAQHRNQRHLRRHWRELGEQRIEHFVHERETDLAQLREALELESSARQRIEHFVREREADLALVREALDLESSTRQQELKLLQTQLKDVYDALAEAQRRAAEREAELSAIHASRSWRYTRIFRKQ